MAAAGDLVQTGTAVGVGFNGYTNNNLIMQAVTFSPGDADVKPILGEQNAPVTKLLTNPRSGIELTGVLKAAGSELATLIAYKIGTILTVNSVKYFLDAPPKVEFSGEEARVTLVGIREDSMAATYDTE